jgi:hypothetical protein
MNKDNEKVIKYDLDEKTSLRLIKDGFKALPANRSVNYRNKLYIHLNKIVKPKVKDLTWKKRFLKPDSIPQKNELIPIMVEAVMLFVQIYRNDCNAQICSLQNDMKLLDEILFVYTNE